MTLPLVDVKYLVMTTKFRLYPGITHIDDIPTLHTGCGRPTDHIRLCYVNPLTQVYNIPEWDTDADVTIYPVPISMLTQRGTWHSELRLELPPDVVTQCRQNRSIVVFDGSGESTDILGSVATARVRDFLHRCGLEDHTYNTIVNTCQYYDLPPQNVIVTTGNDITEYSDPNFVWCNMNMVEAVLNPGAPELFRQRKSQIIRGIMPDNHIISYNGRARGHKIDLMRGLYHTQITKNNLISCDSVVGPDSSDIQTELGLPWRTSDIRDAQPPTVRNNPGSELTSEEAWHTHYLYYYSPESQRELLNSAVCLSTETWGHDVPLSQGRFHHVSEKTYRPIVSVMPFVSWSQNYTLARLHSQGYETFSGHWSEDYDTEPDPVKKTELVLDVCQLIASQSDSDIIELLRQTLPECEHNYWNYYQRWHSGAHTLNLWHTLMAWEPV